MDDGSVKRAVDAVRSAADPATDWKDVIEALCAALGADGGNFAEWDLDAMVPTTFVTVNHEESADRLYREYYCQHDPLAHKGLISPAGAWMSTALLEEHERRRSSEFFSDFLRPIRHAQADAIIIDRRPSEAASVGFQYSKAKPDPALFIESLPMRLLTAALTGSYGERRLKQLLQREQAFALLRPEAEAWLLVGEDGAMAGKDIAIPAWISAGRTWRARSGKLVHSDRGEQARFLSLIAKTLDTGDSQASSFKGSWGEIFKVSASRLPGGPPGLVRCAAVRIERRDVFSPPSEEALRSVFDITKAEAKLFRLLLQGEDLKRSSELLAVSINTVRKQLASIMAKTGCTRQSELIRLGSLV